MTHRNDCLGRKKREREKQEGKTYILFLLFPLFQSFTNKIDIKYLQSILISFVQQLIQGNFLNKKMHSDQIIDKTFCISATSNSMEIKSKYFLPTMDKRILAYLNQLEPPIDISLPGKATQWLYPLKNSETCRCMQEFYSKYYSDSNERILVLAINPGRFGSGTTGSSLILI